MTKKKNSQPVSYEEAYEELLAIQQAVEQNEVPIDALEEKLQRAMTLLQFCQNKLQSVDNQVKIILTQAK